MDVLRLHKLTDRDRQGQLIEVYNEGKQDTAAAASDLLVYHTPVPQDKMLLVESWCVLVVSDMSEPYQAAFDASFTLSGTQYFAALHEKFWNFEGKSTYINATVKGLDAVWTVYGMSEEIVYLSNINEQVYIFDKEFAVRNPGHNFKLKLVVKFELDGKSVNLVSMELRQCNDIPIGDPEL